jgi:hypothetical protein
VTNLDFDVAIEELFVSFKVPFRLASLGAAEPWRLRWIFGKGFPDNKRPVSQWFPVRRILLLPNHL